jgi:glucose-1-phosphate thymidylyltransferase
MKIIVPMAGMGKRMRPHTLTIPKPLIPIAGKPIVQRLVEDIAATCHEQIDEVAFIIGDFGEETEQRLIQIAENLGARGSIYYQEEALGTAHAILCAAPSLDGKVIIAFADTLFRADFKLDDDNDGIIWVQRIPDPEQFGVVVVDEDFVITDYVEKSKEFVSDLAMIGIYYIKDGANLKGELQFLIDNEIIKGGEYQLPDAFRHMTEKGMKLTPVDVQDWLDCGNKNATVATNSSILNYIREESIVSASAKMENAQVIEPCFIGENVILRNSVVGPGVSIGDGSVIEDCEIQHSIIQEGAEIRNSKFGNSMIGNYAKIDGATSEMSLGDYSTYGI